MIANPRSEKILQSRKFRVDSLEPGAVLLQSISVIQIGGITYRLERLMIALVDKFLLTHELDVFQVLRVCDS